MNVTTVDVESAFSKMSYNKSKARNRLSDDKVVDILKLQQAEKILKEPRMPQGTIQLDIESALAHKILLNHY